jgi:hypothetical protein
MSFEVSKEPYIVKCLDAVYEPTSGDMVLNVYFERLDYNRIVVLNNYKSLFHYKKHGVDVPDEEMFKLAKLMKHKRFKMFIEDDPNKEKITPENQEKYIKMFREEISGHLDKVTEGLTDDKTILSMKIDRLINKNKTEDINDD